MKLSLLKVLKEFRLSSAAVIAVLAFLFINNLLEKSFRHLIAINAWSSVMLSGIDQLTKNQHPLDVVLVGSSLMRYPMWHVDAKYALSPSDARFETYHGARWFEKKLAEEEHRETGILDLSMDGATIADVYLICDKLLRGPRCPELIIYGMADRDMLCGLFHGERHDPAFELLFEPEDCNRLGGLYTTDLWDRFDLELSQRFPLYKARQVIQERASHWGQRINHTFNPMLRLTKLTTGENYSTTFLTNRDEEFTTRYSKAWAAKKKLVENQKACLSLLSKLARERNCCLLLVNMPLRRTPFKQTKQYEEYLRVLKLCAQPPHTYLLDLADQSSTFHNECFLKDGGHMNAIGGERLIIRLIEWIKEHKQYVAAPINSNPPAEARGPNRLNLNCSS
ncbi:MAG: hypothetical protein C5B53_03220 [Candidatus Melainabacteria bacterium]|nr:MAG: hypothetical protein C5B53_03220 [Candidatus Melainabacteria bacterium]